MHVLQYSLHHEIIRYGVATISRLLKIIRLICKRALLKRLYSAIETYNVKEPTTRSHPIPSYHFTFLFKVAVSCSERRLDGGIAVNVCDRIHEACACDV